MPGLTEAEILDQLRRNVRQAAEHCEDLAVLPQFGPTYRAMREELSLIEGCCRQMAAWRGDARWLPLGLWAEECHKRSQHWLRYHFPRKLFLKLGENLRALQRGMELVEQKATGKLGPIVPKPMPGPLRQGRPVQVKGIKEPLVKRRSGLIVPAHIGV